MSLRAVVISLACVALVACGSDSESSAPGSTATPGESAAPAASVDQRYPDILEATATSSGGTWTFAVTVSSPYDTPERYADGWRVLGPDGEVYGEHTLTHDHATEQPFTRTQSGVSIPDAVDEVTIEGRDLLNGYGGGTLAVTLPR